MRFSVVINTYNRARSLAVTLDALRHQLHDDFEVVVVDGPSDDGTAELLAKHPDVRVVDCPLRNLAVSRNLGIEAAAGEVVAFIDDDAIPEARWLTDLDAAYDTGRVGGAGGLTLDQTGVFAQYRYSVCDRAGRTDFTRRPPLWRYNHERADPFVYLQGTNCSFRRSVLQEIEGFDEEIEYNFDESEVCSRVVDHGYRLAALPDAVVHHKFLPSHMRRREGFTDPYLPVKNRAYFALRVGREYYSTLEIMTSLTAYVDEVTAYMEGATARGDFTQAELDHFVSRARDGFGVGVERGLAGVRKGRTLADADPAAFRPYETLRPEGRRLAVAFVSIDYPPKPVGGIGRFTHDLARGFAAAGHEAHVVTRDDEYPYRVDFEDGVWVHRFPVGPRWLPGLEDAPLRGNLEHAASVHGAVDRIAARVPLDVVSGSLWIAEPLLCAFDDRWATSVACNTPMRKVAELQPETAAAPLTAHQIRLEDTLLESPATLQPVSEENAGLVATVTPKPLHVIWHGVEDAPAVRARTDDAVEILFAGRLEPRKGIDTLLEAATPLLRERADVRLVLLGADNPHANGRPGVFADWVAEHAADVADRIVFRGHVDDDALNQAYADCDVFCAPSRYESFGLVHVEAMMQRRPVVGCDVGGMRETVVDGETGRLVAPGDVEALRAALTELVADPALRERMGSAGRARYEAEFRNDVAVARNVALYETLSPPVAPDLPGALADLCGLESTVAAQVAERLLAPDAFPIDLEAGVRAALAEDDAGFVRQTFLTLLGREPLDTGYVAYLSRLPGEDRIAIVREIATSDEGRARELDLSFLDRLPTRSPRELLHDLGAAWLNDDDDAFRAQAAAALGVDALAAGDRHAAVRAAYDDRDVRARNGPYLSAFDTLRPAGAIAAGLVGATGDGAAFAAELYRLVLGREPDPQAAAYAGIDRAEAVRMVAGSAEGATRGFDAAVAGRIAAAVGAAGGAAGLRERAKHVRARVLGDRPGERVVAELPPQLEAALRPERMDALEARLGERTDSVADTALEVGGDLGTAVAELRDHQWAADANTQEQLALTKQALRALAEQVEVMARKGDALAMDMRERIPPLSFAEAPEPEVLNPDALVSGARVNLGCGEKPLPGYVNVDFRALDGVDVVADVGRLPFAEGSLAELASHHLIEHFRQRQAETVLLPYWRSLLAPDGLLRIVTPNWAVMIEQLNAGTLAFADFKTVTFGLQDYSGDDHFALYTPQTLTELVEAAGFGDVEIVTERRQNGNSPEVELTARPR